jgi:ketosteroid isomerase-like protein
MNANELILNLEVMSNNKNLIAEVVENYAAAINAGEIDKIRSYYSGEGIFMPEGVKTLKKNQIGNKKLPFFKEKDFKIQYNDIKIKVDDNYAFVEAVAQTLENDVMGSSKVERNSRDFFVFQKEGTEWKILTYIFNNFQDYKS